MPKKRVYFVYNIPSNVVNIVKAVCADYERRQRAVESNKANGEVREEYIRLNTIIDEALSDVEIGLRDFFLRDFRDNHGYERSEATFLLSKNAYYRRKRKLIHDVAQALNLIA